MPAEAEPSYACRCLNIKLLRATGSGLGDEQPPTGASQEFKPLYVGNADTGIQIMHNELTLRIRSPVVVDSDGRHTQFTTVQCLVCETLTYRVKNEITPDEDAKEGPVLPSDEWTEKETLLSKQGWLFVHVGTEGCIETEEIKRKSGSSSLSAQFSIVLPPGDHNEEHAHRLPSSLSRTTIPPTHNFLPGLGPFLPPPPFTPTHPIFTHLASIAVEHSKAARDMSEKCIEEFTKKQMAKLEETEVRLRAELEQLWIEVRQNLKKAEMERDGPSGTAPSTSAQRNRNSINAGTGSRALSPSMLSVGSPRLSSFTPIPDVAALRPFSPTNRASALSASIRTSSFHHPREQQRVSESREITTPSPPPYTSNPSSSVGSSGSAANGGIDIARPAHRKMDQTIDTAATYQYYAIKEQEEARMKKEVVKEDVTESKVPDTPKVHSTKSSMAQTQTPAQETRSHTKGSIAEDGKKRDGKRKVTFNVQPDVVTIKRETKNEYGSLPERADDLLFEYDDDSKNTSGEVASPDDSEKHDTDQSVVLSLREAGDKPRAKPTTRTSRDLSEGLSQSFTALRPTSLPAPSHIRPPIRSREGKNKTNVSVASGSNLKDAPSRGPKTQSELALSPMQQEIQKRVGGDMPSHRGSWKADSESWKIFQGNDSDITDEESDDDTESTVTQPRSDLFMALQGIPGSLPTPMPSKATPQLSGTTLQPKTSLTDRPGALVPPLTTISEEGESDSSGSKKSAIARRKEIYSERDRIRGMDPGMLDFADVGVDDSINPDADDDDVPVSRSRQHALNIIKARNSVPAEGLWRSLA